MTAPVFATGDVPSATQVNSWFTNTSFARKAGDTARSSTTTLTADPDLTLAVDASATYELTLMLRYTATPAVDIKFDATIPASAAITASVLYISTGGSYPNPSLAVTDLASTGAALGAGGTIVALRIEGLLTVAGTAGSMTFRWAQNASNAAATTLKASSYLRLRRVA